MDSNSPLASSDDPRLDFSSPTDPMESSLAKSGVAAPAPVDEPSYRVLGDSRIAVSKVRGKLCKSRKDQCEKQMKDYVEAWNEAIRYYSHDQSDHRDPGMMSGSGNLRVARRLNDRHSATENVVFSNVNAQIPMLYAKNPIISINTGVSQDDATKQANSEFSRAVEKLVNVLFAMTTAPGVQAKPKMKKAVLIALLTNCAWLEVGYVQKDNSSENGLATLMELSKELASATKIEDIREIEGKLIALEEKVEFLSPSGPYLRIRLPHQVLVDGDHNDPYLNDAKFVIIADMMPTEYLNAVYGKEEEGSERVMSIYEPTHVLDACTDGDEDTFSMFNDKKDFNAYGFSNTQSFNKAKRTKVWYYWCKVTRRLELYADNDWTWPIWVWDDPYQLAGFFPLTRLWFHENPIGVYAKGEVSYYLDQQDEINEINDEKRRSIAWARRNIFYNSNKVKQEEADKILKGPNGTATGIDLPDGMKLGDVIQSVLPPSAQFTQLFDKKDLYASIDRIAATNEIERGGEFKTNTTNKAVDYYSTQGNQRNDARLDQVEDCIAMVGWQLAQLCLRFMSPDVVKQLTGLEVGNFWKALDPINDMNKWSVACIGGSTTKVGSSARKQEAVQIGQVLAQFVKAAPAAVLTTTLSVFSKAFDDVIMQKEDWEKIEAEVTQTLAMSQGGAPGQNQQPTSAHSPAPAPMPPDAGNGPQPSPSPVAQVVAALQQLPPPILKAIGTALAQGATPAQIIQQMSSHGAPN